MARAAEAETGIRVNVEDLLQLRHLVRNWPDLRLDTTGRPGGFTSKARGSGLEIRDLRPFSDGDDFRHVDAMATARTGKVYVRSYHDEQEKSVLLIADFRSPMFWGTQTRLRSVAVAQVLALAGWRACETGAKVGLMTVSEMGSFLAPRARERAMARVAGRLGHDHDQALDRNETGAPLPLDAALERAGKLMPRGSSLFLATGLDDPGSEFDSVAGAMMRRVRLVIYLLRDGFEIRPPRGTYPYCTLGTPTRWAVIDRQADKPLADARLERLRALGVEVRLIDTRDDGAAMFAAMEAPHAHAG